MIKIKKNIKLGYEIKTGNEISIKQSHLIVTGVTQESGKTTTLESLIQRSGLKAIVFRTKIGEKSFLKGTMIPPFFKDKSDWQYVSSLLEATMKEKMRFERAWIIRACKGTTSLIEVKKNIDNFLLNEKLNQLSRNVYETLNAYFELVLPKLQTMTFSNSLEIQSGVNIIDLERFSRDPEVQSLIIRSVAEEVLNNYKDIILVIPEAWKFLPQGRGNPCKLVVEQFVREGATNGNFVWIDSQDMAGVDKIPLKQVSTWILGYQAEINEVKHTLDQIPLAKSKKPRADEIMKLGIGNFILATREKTTQIYVQPFWLNDNKSKQIALGKLKVSEIDAPESIAPFKIAIKKEGAIEQPTIDFSETTKRYQKELNEMRGDFFNKIAEMQEQINQIYTEIYNFKNQPKQDIDEDTLIQKVLQKMPAQQIQQTPVNEEKLISKILAKVPKSTGADVYEVAPLEKIKKDFLNKTKEFVLGKISELDDEQKKILKFVEVQQKGCNATHIIDKCLFLSATSGGNRDRIAKKTIAMGNLGVVKRDKNGTYPNLKELIKSYLGTHEATEQEIEGVYNHILNDLI